MVADAVKGINLTLRIALHHCEILERWLKLNVSYQSIIFQKDLLTCIS